MMNKITNLERALPQAQKPPSKGHPQGASQAWRPCAPNEQRVPNTLDPQMLQVKKRPLGAYLVEILILNMNAQELLMGDLITREFS
jgi:hypothetical protein